MGYRNKLAQFTLWVREIITAFKTSYRREAGHLHCGRCDKLVDTDGPPKGMTAGYYDCTGDPGLNEWARYAQPGEKYLCDACMWGTPDFIARRGVHLP